MNTSYDNEARKSALSGARNVLAVAPDRACGFAAGQFGVMVSGAWYISEYSQTYTPEEKITDRLDALHQALPFDLVVVKASRLAKRGKKARTLADRCADIVEAWATSNNVPVVTVREGEFKKSFTGHGSCSSERVLFEVEKRGIGAATASEALAIALFDWALRGAMEGVAAAA